MQNHIDRDNFVQINKENIKKKQRHNFKKVSLGEFGDFGTNYDYLSVMHYNSKAFHKNGEDTIVVSAKNSSGLKRLDYLLTKMIGQQKNLSKGDITRINRMYKCKLQ